MNRGRQFVVILGGALLLSTVSCAHKKPQLPPQAKAPVEPIAVPLPAQIAEETPPEEPSAPEQEEARKVEEPKTQPTKRRKRKAGQTAPTTQTSANNPPAASPNTTIASARPPANPASEPPPDTAIAADVTSAQLTHQKQTTSQLLDATEKTLNGLSHNLSHDEQEVVTQIRSYVAQSRKATTDGDFERAYNLATKAHLLSDALAKK